MLLRLSRFIHLIPIAADRVLIVDAISHVRVAVNGEFANYVQSFSDPKDVPPSEVIDALIDKYADQGIRTIESDDILTVPPINTLGSPVELVRSFGGRSQFLSAIKLLENELYSPNAT